jgi:hypothetical protein
MFSECRRAASVYYTTASGYNGSTPWWSTLDLDGDGRPDLVRTSDANSMSLGDGGAAHCAFFKNTGSGFAAAVDWPVPNTTYYATTSGYNSSTPWWMTFDLDGDRCPDLVATSGGGNVSYGEAGAPQWRLFPGK